MVRLLILGAFSLALLRRCFFGEGIVSSADWRIIRFPLIIFMLFIVYSFIQSLAGPKALWLNKGLGSIQSFSTERQSLQLLYYAAFFLLILDFLSSRSRMRFAIFLMGAQAAFLVFWGYLQNLPHVARITPLEKLQAFYSNPSFSSPFSTFLDSNHYGCYLMLTIPLFLGAIAYCYETAGPRLRSDRYLLENIFYVLLIPLILASSYAAEARAAFLVQIFLVLLFWWAGLSKNNRAKSFWTLVFLVAALFISLRWLKPEIVQQTLAQLPESASNRWLLYREVWRVAADYPVFGVGLGCFRWVYRIYQTMNPEHAYFPHPNSDHLELLVEGGWVGYGLAAGAVALLVIFSFKPKRWASSRWRRVMGTASLIAVLALILLSFTEDYLETPAIAIFFILHLALLVKCATWDGSPAPTDPPDFWSTPLSAAVRTGFLILGAVSVVFFVRDAVNDAIVQRIVLENSHTIRTVERYTYEVIPPERKNLSQVFKITSLQPKNPRTWFLLGDAYFEESLRQFGPAGQQLIGQSVKAYERAVSLAPTWAEAWMALGEAKFISGRGVEGVEDIEKGVEFVPTNRDFHVYLITICLNAARYTLSQAQAGVFKEKALRWMEKATQLPYPLTPDDMDYRNPAQGGARLNPDEKAQMLALYRDLVSSKRK